MGIIGNNILDRIAKAEFEDNWDMVLELLAMAQLNAAKNYIKLLKENAIDTTNALTGHMGE